MCNNSLQIRFLHIACAFIFIVIFLLLLLDGNIFIFLQNFTQMCGN